MSNPATKMIVVYAIATGLEVDILITPPKGETPGARVDDAWIAICRHYVGKPTFLAALEIDASNDTAKVAERLRSLYEVPLTASLVARMEMGQ